MADVTRQQAVSANAAVASISAPTTGDLIVVFAFNGTNATIPSLPAGYTTLNSAAGTGQAFRAGYKISVGSETDTGTWTNATQVVAHVYRNSRAVTAATGVNTSGNSATLSYAGITLQDTNGESWIVGFAGAKAATAGMSGSTTNLGNRTNVTTANGLDSGGGKTSFSTETLAVTGSGRWVTLVLEIRGHAQADGASGGTSTSAATSGSTDGIAGSSSGVGAASGAGVAVWDSVGSSSGAGSAAADGIGISNGEAEGIASGSASVAAITGATKESDGSSTGVASDSVASNALWNSVANSSGVASASSAGSRIISTAGSVSGTGAASANGTGLVAVHTEVYGQPLDDPGCNLHWVGYKPDPSVFGVGPYPACLLIHGGKFNSETPTSNPDQRTAARDMADAGYLALSIEFRLVTHPISGQTTTGQYDQQPVDCKMALDAVLIDSRCNGKAVIIGGSSGGTEAAMLCLNWNSGPRPLGACCISPATKFSDRTDPGYITLTQFIAAIQAYTNTDDSPGGLATQLADSPVSFVDATAKPMFFVFSINDSMPYPQLADMTSALDTAGVTNYLQTTLSGDGHSWDNWASVRDATIAFFNGLVAITEAVASSSGTGAASGHSATVFAAAASAAGVGAATAAADDAGAIGSQAFADGTAAAAGVSASAFKFVASATGISSVAGLPALFIPADATATGTSAASAGAENTEAADGSSIGVAIVAGVSEPMEIMWHPFVDTGRSPSWHAEGETSWPKITGPLSWED